MGGELYLDPNMKDHSHQEGHMATTTGLVNLRTRQMKHYSKSERTSFKKELHDWQTPLTCRVVQRRVSASACTPGIHGSEVCFTDT
jgi:hypothetical protein